MIPALWVAKTGLDAQQTNLSVISHNLANVNTKGYKRDRASFEDLLYQTVRQPGSQSSQTTVLPTGLMLGTGVRLVSTQKIFTQGNVFSTGNSLDVAINGRGFLQIQMPDGTTAYTRNGELHMNAQGQLTTSNGYALQPAITVPQGAVSLSIGNDGVVSAQVSGATAPTQIGQIQLADFINTTGLQPIGENLFRETASSGAPTTGNPGNSGLGTLSQGSLEGSNVNAVEELVNLIEGSRAYEMNSKAIATADSMLKFVNQTIS